MAHTSSPPPDGIVISVRVNEDADRATNPHVPCTAEDLALDARRCEEAGAAMIHYHARDPETARPTSSIDAYRDAQLAIKAASNLITEPTLGAWWTGANVDRLEHLVVLASDEATRAEMAPLDLASGTVDHYDEPSRRFRSRTSVYVNTTEHWTSSCDRMRVLGMKPMLTCWSVGSLRAARALQQSGHLDGQVCCELSLTENGIIACHPGTDEGLAAYLPFVPDDWAWWVLGNGFDLLPLVPRVVELGGHVAIGLGDHSYSQDGPRSNAQLVEQVVAIAERAGRPVLSPDEARRLMGLRALPRTSSDPASEASHQ